MPSPTLAEAWRHQRELTRLSSINARNLAIVGLAAVWLFTGLSDGDLTKARPLGFWFGLAGIAFALSLAADAVQYPLSAMLLRHWLNKPEQKNASGDLEREIPKHVLNSGYWLFVAKFVSALTGYLFFAIGLVGEGVL